MKRLLPLLFILPLTANCQRYANINPMGYKTVADYKAAIEIGAGYIFKEKESQKRNYMVGAGAALLPVDRSHIYTPIYAQAGYFNSFDKVTPYVLAQVGYALYKGPGNFIGIDKELQGGVFMSLKAGAGFKLNRVFSIAPFIGVSYLMLREKIDKYHTYDYYKALLNAGISFIIF